LQKYDIYGKGQDSGRLIRLNANFRSDKKILKFVDDVFGGVMTEEFGGLNYDPDAVFIPGKKNLDKPNAMNLIYIDTTVPKAKKAEARGVYSVKNHTQEESAEVKAAIAEARVVASKIAELVDENNNVVGNQIGRAFSIGTSKDGSMMGFNAGVGLKDFMTLGKLKVTPSVGWRYLKYTLETHNNHGLSMESFDSGNSCYMVEGSDELQCDPLHRPQLSGYLLRVSVLLCLWK
jgi:hypothetical protein